MAKRRYVLDCNHHWGTHRVVDTQSPYQSGDSHPSHKQAVRAARSLNEEHEDRLAHPEEYR